MVDIAVYVCDDSGAVQYKGVEQWDSELDFWSYYFRDDDVPAVEPLLGWPHKSVEWRRGTGIGRSE